MSYVDGYVIVVPTKKLAEYKKMAKEGKETWMKFGALDYKECVIDDAKPEHVTVTFPMLTNAKKTDTVIFSYIVYKSRAHRDSVNKKVHAFFGEKYKDAKDQEMPFDMSKFSFAGFKAFVEA